MTSQLVVPRLLPVETKSYIQLEVFKVTISNTSMQRGILGWICLIELRLECIHTLLFGLCCMFLVPGTKRPTASDYLSTSNPTTILTKIVQVAPFLIQNVACSCKNEGVSRLAKEAHSTVGLGNVNVFLHMSHNYHYCRHSAKILLHPSQRVMISF
jgi:hypothetical protein